MERLKHLWSRVPRAVRKPLVLMIGITVIAFGILGLLLPILPGWVLIFLGFAILATEFAAAERVRDWFIELLKRLVERAKRPFQHRSKTRH